MSVKDIGNAMHWHLVTTSWRCDGCGAEVTRTNPSPHVLPKGWWTETEVDQFSRRHCCSGECICRVDPYVSNHWEKYE